ncbi:MAG: SPASM domain-containing protein, partial [Oscillospiraceae bacterium]|nr:SPASM domain-containing protein [Oscillospiraceae bacterium]
QHDWLRGIEGSEKTVINAFKLCRDRGYATNTELCLHQYNKHTLRESVNLLASLGVGSVKTNPASMSGAWIENAGDANLTIQELYEVYLDYIPHYFEDGAPMNIQLGGFFYGRKGEMKYMLPSVKCDGAEKAGRQVICGHARKVMYISAEGRILPCMSLSGLDVQKDYPLVTEIGLVKCLTNSTYMRLIGSTVDDFLENCTECAECEFKYQCCTGCRASAMDSGGDLMGPDRACCEFFKGGIISRIIEAAKGAECVNYQISE